MKQWDSIIGIDEVGRGPLAGPVVAAAVAIRHPRRSSNPLPKCFDSKKLSPISRGRICRALKNHPDVMWGVGRAGERIIERTDILTATKLAMMRAVMCLEKKLKASGEERSLALVIDGNFALPVLRAQKSVIRADESVFEVSAASIIAKVARDRLMQRLHICYPCYGFDLHKGYGTKQHYEALRLYGPCPAHRRSFCVALFRDKEQ